MVRIALLVCFTVTGSTSPFISLLTLFIVVALLLFYVSIRPVYKSKFIRTFNSVSLLNLVILVGSIMHRGTTATQSFRSFHYINFAFAQFTIIIVVCLIKTFYRLRDKCTITSDYIPVAQDVDSSVETIHERIEDPESSNVT